MASNGQSQQGIRPSRGLLMGGGVLVAVGGLLELAGILLVGSALAAATRQWARTLEQPPAETAKVKLRQARAATTAATHAGARAWQGEG